MDGKLPIVQIAGVLDRKDALVLAKAGVTHIGFPLHLDVNPEEITVDAAADIIADLPRSVIPVLITYLATAETVTKLCLTIGCRTVQLHGDVTTEELRRLRETAPSLSIWKSLVVGKHAEEKLQRQVYNDAPFVDAFITDTYSPRTGASGATGEVHDWEVSRRLVRTSPVPVILAGGLTPANVADAVAFVAPAGVDSHTGVETAHGRNDPALVNAFVHNARQAFAKLDAERTRQSLR